MHLIMHHMLLNGAALLQNLSLRVDHAHPVMTDYLDEVAGYVGKTGSPAGRGLSCVRSTTSDIGFDNWFPSNFDCRKKPICRSFCIKCCRQHLMREIRQSASKRRVKACWDSIGYPGQRFGRKRTRT